MWREFIRQLLIWDKLILLAATGRMRHMSFQFNWLITLIGECFTWGSNTVLTPDQELWGIVVVYPKNMLFIHLQLLQFCTLYCMSVKFLCKLETWFGVLVGVCMRMRSLFNWSWSGPQRSSLSWCSTAEDLVNYSLNNERRRSTVTTVSIHLSLKTDGD